MLIACSSKAGACAGLDFSERLATASVPPSGSRVQQHKRPQHRVATGSEAMAPQSAQSTQQRSAISADRIFDGYRWHDHAAVVIRQGLIEGIGPRGQMLP